MPTKFDTCFAAVERRFLLARMCDSGNAQGPHLNPSKTATVGQAIGCRRRRALQSPVACPGKALVQDHGGRPEGGGLPDGAEEEMQSRQGAGLVHRFLPRRSSTSSPSPHAVTYVMMAFSCLVQGSQAWPFTPPTFTAGARRAALRPPCMTRGGGGSGPHLRHRRQRGGHDKVTCDMLTTLEVCYESLPAGLPPWDLYRSHATKFH